MSKQPKPRKIDVKADDGSVFSSLKIIAHCAHYGQPDECTVLSMESGTCVFVGWTGDDVPYDHLTVLAGSVTASVGHLNQSVGKDESLALEHGPLTLSTEVLSQVRLTGPRRTSAGTNTHLAAGRPCIGGPWVIGPPPPPRRPGPAIPNFIVIGPKLSA